MIFLLLAQLNSVSPLSHDGLNYCVLILKMRQVFAVQTIGNLVIPTENTGIQSGQAYRQGTNQTVPLESHQLIYCFCPRFFESKRDPLLFSALIPPLSDLQCNAAPIPGHSLSTSRYSDFNFLP